MANPFLTVGILVTALSSVIAWQLYLGGDPPSLPATPVANRARSTQPPQVQPDLPRLAATLLARPLFSPIRRPPQPAVAAAAGPSDLTIPRLTGILVSPGGGKAIFDGAPRPIIVQQGERLGRFTVRSIGPGEIILQGPGGARALRPSFNATHSTAQASAGMPLLPAPPFAPPAKPPPSAPQVPPPTGLADLRRQLSQATAARELTP